VYLDHSGDDGSAGILIGAIMNGINLKGKLYDFIRNTPSIFFVPVSGDTVECRLESSNFSWQISNNDFRNSVEYDPEGWNRRKKPRKGEIPFVRISKDGQRENLYVLARHLIIMEFYIGDMRYCQGVFYKGDNDIGMLTHDAEEVQAYAPDAFFEVDLFQEEREHWNQDDVRVLKAAGFKIHIVEV
jgi:hypothetical protein